ncbi:hypothetical protein AHAS_Ahas07G0119000 [Arachis hypogaea]
MFYLSVDEVTVTLKDVTDILGLSINGESVTGRMGSSHQFFGLKVESLAPTNKIYAKFIWRPYMEVVVPDDLIVNLFMCSTKPLLVSFKYMEWYPTDQLRPDPAFQIGDARCRRLSSPQNHEWSNRNSKKADVNEPQEQLPSLAGLQQQNPPHEQHLTVLKLFKFRHMSTSFRCRYMTTSSRCQGRSRMRSSVLVGAVESNLMMVAGAAVSDLLDLVVVLILRHRRVVDLGRVPLFGPFLGFSGDLAELFEKRSGSSDLKRSVDLSPDNSGRTAQPRAFPVLGTCNVFPWEKLELLDLESILEEFQFSINNEFDNSRVTN